MTDPRIERIAARQHAQTAAARMTVTPLLDAPETTDDEVAQIVDLFPAWIDKTGYKVGAVAPVTASCIGACKPTPRKPTGHPARCPRCGHRSAKPQAPTLTRGGNQPGHRTHTPKATG